MDMTTIAINPFNAEFKCTDAAGKPDWAPCTVIGVQCNNSDRPELVVLTTCEDGMVVALTLHEVRPVK